MSATTSSQNIVMTKDHHTHKNDVMPPPPPSLLEFNETNDNSNSFPHSISRQSTQVPQFTETFLPEDIDYDNNNNMYYRSTHDHNKQKDLGLGKSILKKRTSEQEGFQQSNMHDTKKSIHEASIRIAKAPLVEDEHRFSELKDVDKVGKESTTKQEIRFSRN